MISVQRMSELRKELGVTHLVLFSIDDKGSQNVATHGKTEKQAIEAADYGNNLKEYLGFPEKMCKSKPIERLCVNCDYYQRMPGFGWQPCYCNFSVPKQEINKERKACGNFSSKY